MEYHIVHRNPNFSVQYERRVDESFVNKLVKCFLRGEEETLVNGKKYKVGSSVFRIYEDTKKEGLGGAVLVSIEAYELTKSQDIEDYFEKNFKNVTDSFLLGRAWGDLKQDYFNIYVNDGLEKLVVTVLTKAEVDEFLADWANGTSPIWISRRRVDIVDPKSIRIFDIKFEYLSKHRGEIKEFQRKVVNQLFKGKWPISALEYFGKDVSDNWTIPAYGRASKTVGNQKQDFNWGMIHSVIREVAQPRFASKQYADAVEAALKEINEVIKFEYKKRTGSEEDGTPLMRKAFGQNPVIKLNDLSTESKKNIQEGYMNIFAGTMIGIRNPKAHSNLTIDEIDSWEKIMLASHLMKMFENRIKENEKP